MMAWEIVRVPENPPLSHASLSTVAVLAAAVEPKSANALVRQLGQIAPLENLRHVKRVRRRSDGGKNELDLILCPVVEGEEFMDGVPTAVLRLIEDHKLSPFVAKVAKFAATFKEEWEDQCRLWPTSYHPPCNIDGITSFSKEDSKLICSFMKIALDLSRAEHLHDQVVNSAVIVDPSSGKIIASAFDETTPIPKNRGDIENGEITNLPVPKATDIQSGELSGCCASECVLPSDNGVACLYPWRWTEQTSPSQGTSACSQSWHPLRHAALVAIESAAARDRRLFPKLADKTGAISNDQPIRCSSNSPAKRQKTVTSEMEPETTQEEVPDCLLSEIDQGTRPYLCTGFDIYLAWEPCPMCAMALVHQRIRRIFFAFLNPNTGALGSVHRLHGEKSLNHHYTVFRIMVPADS